MNNPTKDARNLILAHMEVCGDIEMAKKSAIITATMLRLDKATHFVKQRSHWELVVVAIKKLSDIQLRA